MGPKWLEEWGRLKKWKKRKRPQGEVGGTSCRITRCGILIALTAPKPPPEDIEEDRGPKTPALAPVGLRGQSSLALTSFCYYYLPAPRRSSRRLLDLLLARRLILGRKLDLR